VTKRLAAQDWTDFALKTLAREGFDAQKADVLARKLGVSRGSFYWHFTDLDDFHARVVEHWRQTATEAVIADLERYGSREERLEVLLRRALGHHNALEMRMRAWADNSAGRARHGPQAARVHGTSTRGRRHRAHPGGNAGTAVVLDLSRCRLEPDQTYWQAARSDRHRAQADRVRRAACRHRGLPLAPVVEVGTLACIATGSCAMHVRF
jgi:AcrR family transcriptional regulator